MRGQTYCTFVDYLKYGCGIEGVGCELYESLFTCQQNIEEHKQYVHGINNFFKCNICPKTFIKRKPLADHIIKVHRTPNVVCLECGKITKSQKHHKEHMKLCKNMHQHLGKRLGKGVYFVKDVLNLNHGDRRLRAVRHLNSYAICI